MEQVTMTPEARTLTTLVVEETTVVPIGMIVNKHIPTDMKAVRANERSSTDYDFTVTNNLTGQETDMVGHYTVGFESSTLKSTLGFNLEALLRAVHGSNNPAMNKFMRAFAEGAKMRQAGATDEEVEAFHAENQIVSSKKTDADFKKWKETLQGEMVKPYSAVVKVHPADA